MPRLDARCSHGLRTDMSVLPSRVTTEVVTLACAPKWQRKFWPEGRTGSEDPAVSPKRTAAPSRPESNGGSDSMPPPAQSRSPGPVATGGVRWCPKAPRYPFGWMLPSGIVAAAGADKSAPESLGTTPKRGARWPTLRATLAGVAEHAETHSRRPIDPRPKARANRGCLPGPLVTLPVARHDGERPRAAFPEQSHKVPKDRTRSPSSEDLGEGRRNPEVATWPGSSSRGRGPSPDQTR